MGWRSSLLTYRRNGLVIKIKHKSNLLDLSIVSNGDLLASLTIPGPKVLHGFHDILDFLHFAKTTCLPFNHSVVAVQMKHGKLFVLGPAFVMDKMPGPVCFRILIIKFPPIDGLATTAIMTCEVTTLTHKPWNNSGKAETLITKSFLSNAQSMNIFCCLWNFVYKQLEGNLAQGLTSNSVIEEHSEVDHGWWQGAPGSVGTFKAELFLNNPNYLTTFISVYWSLKIQAITAQAIQYLDRAPVIFEWILPMNQKFSLWLKHLL